MSDTDDASDVPAAIEEPTPAAAVPDPPRKNWVGLPSPSARRRWGMNPEDRMRVMETCMVLPGAGWLMHFTLMMSMAVIVAIMGLSANSPALVIGAMLIAPLMTPVLGIAASIAMALGDAAARAALVVTCATLGAIVAGYVIAGWLPGELLTNEVLARTAPDARDLVVALAAGLAGSYATARPDVSSSLPGVAIAVALVPPLAVVGITLRAGEGDLAVGALLLYATNLAAIITVSTVVFVLTGFVPGRRLANMAPRVIAGGLIAFIVVAILGTLLGIRSYQSAQISGDLTDIRLATETWLDGTFNEAEVELVGDDEVEITVTGPSQLPPSGELRTQIEQILERPVDLNLSWIQGKTAKAVRAEEEENARTAAQNAAINEVIAEWLDAYADESVYDVSDIEIGADAVVVSMSSLIEAPDSTDLEARLEQQLGESLEVSLNFIDESSNETQRLIAETQALARSVAQAWAEERDVEVESLTFAGGRLSVDLIGEVAPVDGADLEEQLKEIVGDDAEVNVAFIQRVPLIPAPAPTPTPTAAPTPTPTPEPTPTPAPTSEPADEELAPEAEPFIYVIQSGDLVSQITQTFNITIDELLEANPDLDPNVLLIGQELIIPGQG